MKTSRVLSALALACALALLSGLSHAQILTLQDIEARAQRPRPELMERLASIEAAQAELKVVKSQHAPTLGANFEAGIAPGGRLITVTDVNDDEYFVSGSRALGESEALIALPRYAATLGGKLTLFDFGRERAGTRAAEAAIGAEQANLISAKLELVQAAREAYLGWLEAHQTLQLAERDLEVAKARTVSVRALIKEGARPATDATLSLYDEQLAELSQRRAARASSSALASLASLVQSELPPRAVPDLDVLEPVVGEAASPPRAGANDPAGKAREALALQHQAALSAADAAEKASAPLLDVSAELGIQGQLDTVFPMYRAGIALSVPLWDGGQSSAQAAVHRAEARGLEARMRTAERTLREQARAARKRSEDAAVELGLSLELFRTAELMLAEAEDHYRSGSDTLERVLGAQRSLVQARHEVLAARLEAARARLELTPVQIQP